MEMVKLPSLVLMLIMVGTILGIGILVLDKFAISSGVTPTTTTSLNNTRDAIADISTSWLPLIVIVAVLALFLTLIIRNFGIMGRGS